MKGRNHFSSEEQAARALARQAQERDDLGNALNGNFETGRRINRGHKAKNDEEATRKKNDKKALSAAASLGAKYAALYKSTANRLITLQDQVYSAFNETIAQLEIERANLQVMLDGASTLPDGTTVFQSSDGNVYTRDGRLLDEDEAADINWRKPSVTYEALQRQDGLVNQIEGRRDRLQSNFDTLAAFDEEMNADEKPSEDRLKEILEEMDGIEDDLHHQNVRAEKLVVSEQSSVNVPDLNL